MNQLKDKNFLKFHPDIFCPECQFSMLNALLFNVPFWLFIFKSILANLKDIVTLFQLPPLATLTTFPGYQKSLAQKIIASFLLLNFKSVVAHLRYCHPFPTPTFGHPDHLPWSLGPSCWTSDASATSSLLRCWHYSDQISKDWSWGRRGWVAIGEEGKLCPERICPKKCIFLAIRYIFLDIENIFLKVFVNN